MKARLTWPSVFASVAALGVMSCVDNDTSLYVEAVMAAQAPGCEYTADPTASQFFRGALDVGLVRSYGAVLLVGNQLTPRGEKNQLRTETQGVELRGAEVRLTDFEGTVLEEFSTPTGGFVHPNTGDAPGYGLTRVTLVPPTEGERLANQLNRGERQSLVANVRVFGDTLGGVEVTSGEFTFVIDVCVGCLVDFPSEALEDAGGGLGPQCTGSSEGLTAAQCTPGQDEVVDCRQCAGRDICLNP